jgi:hypothetical protein
MAGEGLLQTTGLEKREAGAEEAAPAAVPVKKSRRGPGPLVRWWERFQHWQGERDKKRKVLGAWVVYFSLAALPIFGLGQALIPVEDAGRRAFAFWLMTTYIGCALGLLLTTCFLGLRRYLRQRKLKMPAGLTVTWLALGGGLIVALMVVGALLPRPQAEYALIQFTPVGAKQRDASDYAVKGGEGGKDKGKPDGKRPTDKPNDHPADKSSSGQGQDKDGASGKDKDGSGGGNKDGKSGGKDGDRDKGDAAKKDKDGDSAKDRGQDRPKDSPQSKDPQQPRDDKSSKIGRDDQNKQQSQSSSNKAPQSNQSWTSWTGPLQGVAELIKWIVFVVVAMIVAFLAFRHGLRFLANFSDWAKRWLDAINNFWNNLFARRAKDDDADAGDGEEADRKAAGRRFASFGNPFDDGRAGRMPAKELVRFTFAALQAWARERGLERQVGDTPLEFAARLGQEFPGFDADLRRFAALYARAVYDFTPLPGVTAEAVQRFWQRLEQAAEQPLSL